MGTSFHDQITSNKIKSYVLIIAFSFIVIMLGFVFGEYLIGNYLLGIIIAFIIAVIYSVFTFNSGDSMILAASKAKPVTHKDDPYLLNIVEGLALAAQLPVPKVYMIQEESINAFATGKDPNHASITVTSGARKRLSKLELEGVIAHEMSHIQNYDIRVMMLVAVLLGVVVLLSDIMFRSFLWAPRSNRREGGNAGLIMVGIVLVLAILAPIAAQLIRLAVSRKREYLADASGAELTRYPKGLADALEKIKNDHDVVVDTANRGMAHLFIENPLRNRKISFRSLFATHPPIDDRIKKLNQM